MKKEMTFEAALSKLEQVVQKMESGETTLDESLKLFEEGTALASFCYEKLKYAEQKMQQIADLKEEEKDAESRPDGISKGH